jgi:hypothetical protein
VGFSQIILAVGITLPDIPEKANRFFSTTISTAGNFLLIQDLITYLKYVYVVRFIGTCYRVDGATARTGM